MVYGIDLAHLASNIIEELVDCRVGVDPHPHLRFFSQKTALNIHVGLSEPLENGLMAV